jgi:hypothetical protein
MEYLASGSPRAQALNREQIPLTPPLDAAPDPFVPRVRQPEASACVRERYNSKLDAQGRK